MEKTYEEELSIPLFNLDFKGEHPLGQLVSQLVHVAGEHATTYGFGIQKLMSEGYTWVLSRLSIDLVAEIDVSQPLRITTGVRSYSGLTTERVMLVSQENSGLVGAALSRWVAIDIEERRPVPIDKILNDPTIIVDYSDVALPSIPRRLILPKQEEELQEVYTHTVRYSDLDINGHVNSAKWVNMAQDAIPADELTDKRMKRAHLYFAHEARMGDELHVHRARGDDSDMMRIQRDGEDCFQLLIEWHSPLQVEKEV